MKDPIQPFDWQRIWLQDYSWTYLGEVALRTTVMFLLLLLALRLAGKREVGQLSVFELVLVIGLGSAAGDPMFYDDVPLGPVVTVFVVVMLCYKGITRLSDKHKFIRDQLEGVAVYVIEDGQILLQNFDDEDIGRDELYSALRLAGVQQLGQVRIALLEVNGSISVFRYETADVRVGLPILPNELSQETAHITVAGAYACCRCAQVRHLTADAPTACPTCAEKRWVRASPVRLM